MNLFLVHFVCRFLCLPLWHTPISRCWIKQLYLSIVFFFLLLRPPQIVISPLDNYLRDAMRRYHTHYTEYTIIHMYGYGWMDLLTHFYGKLHIISKRTKPLQTNKRINWVSVRAQTHIAHMPINPNWERLLITHQFVERISFCVCVYSPLKLSMLKKQIHCPTGHTEQICTLTINESCMHWSNSLRKF